MAVCVVRDIGHPPDAGVGRQTLQRESQRGESNPQPPHYECGALPIEATLATWGRKALRPKPTKLKDRLRIVKGDTFATIPIRSVWTPLLATGFTILAIARRDRVRPV